MESVKVTSEEATALETPQGAQAAEDLIALPSDTANTTEDGRISVNIDSNFAQAFSRLVESPEEYGGPPPPYQLYEWTGPSLNIVIQVVGSRGDVQPFVALGNELQKSGHRVRIATHQVFETFVRNAGLEFFSIGGDPAELMAYMVKNPGLFPSMKSLRGGEITQKRETIAEMLRGCWRSCIEPDPTTQAPFVANAIIANPVSFAHIHCAQALSVPLHLVFTMPWSPTRAFTHPLANIKNSSTDTGVANYLSFCLVQILTWQGLGDIVNEFRRQLGLRALPQSEAPFIAETLRIPHTYCWSPALAAKPSDWGDHIDVSGFIFRDCPEYIPAPDLASFLVAGPPPVYIGFGSIVIDNPDALLRVILAAVKIAGVRAIISKGWSNFSSADAGENVFFLGDCPHEWLFQHVSVVVHHGGAGTTAAGLLQGRPTIIIPFFGDQPFWGDRVASVGVGPQPIDPKDLTALKLKDAIQFCLKPETACAAARVAEQTRNENGVEACAASFYKSLSCSPLSCDLIPSLPAVYEVKSKNGRSIKISDSAAEFLLKHEKLKIKHLKLYQPRNYQIENQRWDPITAATSSGIKMAYNMVSATNDIWYAPYKIRKETEKKAKLKSKEEDTAIKDSDAGISANNVMRMVGASAMTIPKLYGALLKGMVIDAPLAVTEGFRNAPKLYGEKVEGHRPVDDWKSGAVVGGTEFAKGFSDGICDLFAQPYKGAKENGPMGVLTGLGKGTVGSATKLGAASLGLWAYPAQGAWMSIRTATHQGTTKSILKARRSHATFHYSQQDPACEAKVLEAFK